jgi:tripartite-type tricarboxylate transporter receptor subunit TctC
MVHVPYKGTGPAMISMISGQTTMTITGMVALMPHVKSNRLKLLGVATMKRLAILQDVPTINESGVPGYDANQWYGVLTQAAVPRDIVAKLHADIVKVLARPDIKERLAADGAEPVANTPEQFTAHIKSEIVRWAPVVKASGAKPD